MKSLQPFLAPTVADQLSDRLREALIHGQLPAGQRVNEVDLAATFGVSRTPLREALMRLTAEGTLKSLPRRGFFVPALTPNEIKELYATRAILDPEALSLSGVPSRARLNTLAHLNQNLSKAKTVVERITLDHEWHLRLLEDCSNSILFDLIRRLSDRTRRYELALLWEDNNTQRAVCDHKAVLQALKAKDLNAACQALRRNMKSGLEPILTLLKSHPSSQSRRDSSGQRTAGS